MPAKSKNTSRAKSKKATAQKRKKAARKAQKKSASKALKKPAKKAAKKPTKKPAKKAATKKPATKKAKKGKASAAAENADVLLLIDDLAEVGEMLADAKAAPKKAKKATKKVKAGPKTPTVPRAVKPAPKIAEMELDPELLGFIEAIDRYKQEYSRPFPTWSEIFYIMKTLGYERG